MLVARPSSRCSCQGEGLIDFLDVEVLVGFNDLKSALLLRSHDLHKRCNFTLVCNDGGTVRDELSAAVFRLFADGNFALNIIDPRIIVASRLGAVSTGNQDLRLADWC